jgi:hypothetical protein
MKGILTLLLVAVITALFNINAISADKPADKKTEKADTQEKFRPFRGTIKSVDKVARTITLEGESAQKFAITSDTKINKDGKPAAFADIVVGDSVGGRAKETGEGKWTAMTINAGKRPVAKPEDKVKK